MPFLDVSDLLSDPDIAGQSFTVVRTTSGPPVDGVAQTTASAPIVCYGSVLPASSQELQRMPDGERLGGAVTVRTPFLLIAGGKDAATGLDRTADIVTYADVQYTVMSVQDYSTFGLGYVEALASRLDVR